MNKPPFVIKYLLLISVVVLPAKSQQTKVPAQQRAEFEVASVKPSVSRLGHIGCRVYPGGRVEIKYSTLEMLIEFAFDVESFRVSGGPGWMRDYQERYEVDARPPSTSTFNNANASSLNEEQREMLQALLVDRFHLQFHRETRQGSVYLLT